MEQHPSFVQQLREKSSAAFQLRALKDVYNFSLSFFAKVFQVANMEGAQLQGL